MIYDVWYKGTTDRVILDHFLPFDFDPPNNPKNRYLKKMRKMPGDIVILHLCTANDNHMMWGSSNRYGARQTEFFVILDHFCPPPHPPPSSNNPENQNFEKMKKTLWDDHMLYCSWDMERETSRAAITFLRKFSHTENLRNWKTMQ